jgi:hypothetical protein
MKQSPAGDGVVAALAAMTATSSQMPLYLTSTHEFARRWRQ